MRGVFAVSGGGVACKVSWVWAPRDMGGPGGGGVPGAGKGQGGGGRTAPLPWGVQFFLKSKRGGHILGRGMGSPAPFLHKGGGVACPPPSSIYMHHPPQGSRLGQKIKSGKATLRPLPVHLVPPGLAHPPFFFKSIAWLASLTMD